MIQKLEDSIKSDLRRAEFIADTYFVPDQRGYASCYFRSRKDKKLAYALCVRADVFRPYDKVVFGQKGVLKGTRNLWKWTALSTQWKIDALLLIAWPDWSPDDYVG